MQKAAPAESPGTAEQDRRDNEMTEAEVRAYIEKHVSWDTHALLSNYLQVGVDSRAFMLAEHSKLFIDLENKTGRYKDYVDEQIGFVEGLLSVELLERLMLLIEDLAKVAFGLSGDLRQFPRVVLTQKDPKALLRKIGEPHWRTILRYEPIENLRLPKGDADFLENVRARNIEFLMGFQSVISDFLELHWGTFVKRKHGNTTFFGFQPQSMWGERGILIPTVVDPAKPSTLKGLVVTKRVRERWGGIFASTSGLVRDIVQRNIEFMERGGKGFSERMTYFGMKRAEIENLTRIIANAEASNNRIVIKLHMNAEVSKAVFEKEQKLFEKLDALKNVWLTAPD